MVPELLTNWTPFAIHISCWRFSNELGSNSCLRYCTRIVCHGGQPVQVSVVIDPCQPVAVTTLAICLFYMLHYMSEIFCAKDMLYEIRQVTASSVTVAEPHGTHYKLALLNHRVLSSTRLAGSLRCATVFGKLALDRDKQRACIVFQIYFFQNHFHCNQRFIPLFVFFPAL